MGFAVSHPHENFPFGTTVTIPGNKAFHPVSSRRLAVLKRVMIENIDSCWSIAFVCCPLDPADDNRLRLAIRRSVPIPCFGVVSLVLEGFSNNLPLAWERAIGSVEGEFILEIAEDEASWATDLVCRSFGS
jgi:hypothetical protein